MFRLNRLTDYAVVVMSQLSDRRDALQSSQQIAHASGVPLPTVAKVLNTLSRDGIVESHRGASGGYALARPAAEIAVAEVIEALEGPIALTACVDDAPGYCEAANICPMHGSWNTVNRAIRHALEQVTLADMMADARLTAMGGRAAEDKAVTTDTRRV